MKPKKEIGVQTYFKTEALARNFALALEKDGWTITKIKPVEKEDTIMWIVKAKL